MESTKKELSPIVKWAGGKEQELKYILPNLPVDGFSRFIEPFVGGGAVYFSMNVRKKLINDKSKELINLYNNIKNNNSEFAASLQKLHKAWVGLEFFLGENIDFFENTYNSFKQSKITGDELKEKLRDFLIENKKSLRTLLESDLRKQYNLFEKELVRIISAKLVRMKALEHKKGDLHPKDIYENFEGALKASFYMFIRVLYNKDHFKNSHYFYFIREYCYSSMFRYNSNGDFNVPYGGISYNRKNLQKKIDYIKSQEIKDHFSSTEIYNLDFEEFLNCINLQEDDFIFLDPPYDTDFSSYVNNSFDKADQKRLADYLINECPAKFMVVIKDTEFIKSLYENKGLYIFPFDKKYMVSFKNRNDRDCQHLMITNYEPPIASKTKSEDLSSQMQLQYA